MVSKVRFQRARKEEDKEVRRTALLKAARELFEKHAYGDVKMAEVATRARLAKGTVFLYFPTKESLFLALLEDQLAQWLDQLDAELGTLRPHAGADRVAHVMCTTLLGRLTLTRLLGLLSTVLEHNVELEQVVGFKRFLRDRLGATGHLLERALPGLPEGEGARLLLRVHALVVGLRQTADTPPVVAQALALPDLRPLVVEFDAELAVSLRALLHGFTRP